MYSDVLCTALVLEAEGGDQTAASQLRLCSCSLLSLHGAISKTAPCVRPVFPRPSGRRTEAPRPHEAREPRAHPSLAGLLQLCPRGAGPPELKHIDSPDHRGNPVPASPWCVCRVSPAALVLTVPNPRAASLPPYSSLGQSPPVSAPTGPKGHKHQTSGSNLEIKVSLHLPLES